MTNQGGQVKTAKERVAAWVKIMLDAKLDKAARDHQADRQSIDRAADLEEIYKEMQWVDEIPLPKRKRLGRRTDPKGREQFAKWVKQTYNGWGSQQYLSKLHISTELIPILTPGSEISPTGVKCLGPLGTLREQGYANHQAEVWQNAVWLAGNVAPTEGQVRKAVNEFLEQHKPPVKNVAVDPRTQAQIRAARRARLLREFDEIMAEDNREAHDFIVEVQQHFKSHQDVLREERASA